ncbi:PREDICTED: zinc finger and BTB domain-containing protein 24-like [Polistes dominula]|uniref:Zinc finger and BTB domain-containing protein 24-like n=1 Tax=Polistes dominula TaxID=743375 RepID=A0ABM1IA86_POLDO|nr:PREDICTED: zinc finger and BTB domain-containing protein 24-like [Polistes dominula]
MTIPTATASAFAPIADTGTGALVLVLKEKEKFFVDAVAGPSTCKCFKWYTIEESKSYPIDDNKNNLEVIDLSIRDCNLQSVTKVKVKESDIVEEQKESLDKNVDESTTTYHQSSIDPADKLKDTFLYKIMTDPTFLENIQKNKKQQQQQLQPKKPICPFCHEEFSNYLILSEHMDGKINSETTTTTTTTTTEITCCACKRIFSRKKYLRHHQKSHLEKNKFTCDICTKKYTRMDNLTRHNTFHVNPDKFPCTSCEKTFARKDLLNKHLKCHENKLRFYCEDCDKYFKGQVTLDNHKKFHHAD